MGELVYEIAGKYWDVGLGSYVESVPAGRVVVSLRKDGKPADEAYLIKTLKHYGYPLGQFTEPTETLEERIARLEAELAELKAQAGQFQSNGGISYAV